MCLEEILSADGTRVTVVDKGTGEILEEKREHTVWLNKDEGVTVYNRNNARKRAKSKDGRHFIKLYRTTWRELISTGFLTKAEISVVASLLPFLDWESSYLVNQTNGIPLNETTLAEAICYDKKSLRVQLRNLEKKGIIRIENAGRGKPTKYLFNPHLAIYGVANEHKEECEKFGA